MFGVLAEKAEFILTVRATRILGAPLQSRFGGEGSVHLSTVTLSSGSPDAQFCLHP